MVKLNKPKPEPEDEPDGLDLIGEAIGKLVEQAEYMFQSQLVTELIEKHYLALVPDEPEPGAIQKGADFLKKYFEESGKRYSKDATDCTAFLLGGTGEFLKDHPDLGCRTSCGLVREWCKEGTEAGFKLATEFLLTFVETCRQKGAAIGIRCVLYGMLLIMGRV